MGQHDRDVTSGRTVEQELGCAQGGSSVTAARGGDVGWNRRPVYTPQAAPGGAVSRLSRERNAQYDQMAHESLVPVRGAVVPDAGSAPTGT